MFYPASYKCDRRKMTVMNTNNVCFMTTTIFVCVYVIFNLHYTIQFTCNKNLNIRCRKQSVKWISRYPNLVSSRLQLPNSIVGTKCFPQYTMFYHFRIICFFILRRDSRKWLQYETLAKFNSRLKITTWNTRINFVSFVARKKKLF